MQGVWKLIYHSLVIGFLSQIKTLAHESFTDNALCLWYRPSKLGCSPIWLQLVCLVSDVCKIRVFRIIISMILMFWWF